MSASPESNRTEPSQIERDFLAWETSWRTTASGFFAAGEPVFVARAPGRLDVMGGIADYSGSLVAEMPLAAAAVCGAQAKPGDASVFVRALDPDGSIDPLVELPADLFVNPVSMLRFLRETTPERRWVGYVAGCVSLLRAEGLIPRNTGARLLLRSDVPLGAGVSSSAAIEVATMRALDAAFLCGLSEIELAKLCQRVENDIVDAPCGIMDQVTSALGESGKLLLLRCQPAIIEGFVAIPDDYLVIGFDSRVKHSVGGDAYGRARVAAFLGAKILADTAGEGFGGYLCNVTPNRYLEIVPNRLPETMLGSEFLARHGGILDTVTRVDPAAIYPVRAATEHAIFENERVERFVECLRDGSATALQTAGVAMLGSHESYSRCGLGTDETDFLVETAMAQSGAFGAKITGGGSGGTVCVLCRKDAVDTLIGQVAGNYEAKYGVAPRIIQGTSPGATRTPVLRKVI